MAASQDESFPTLRTSLARYLTSGADSDMKIICGGVEHKLHRMIVCTQSTFFANALKKEHNFMEAQNNTVTLEDDDPATVKAAIKFMYRQVYSNTGYGSDNEQRVTFEISLYTFTDKYGIGGLREYCAKRITKLLDVNQFLPKLFLNVASAVEDNIPENDNVIRPALGLIASKHIHALVDDPQFWSIAGGIGGAVLRNLIAAGRLDGTHTGVPQFTCPGCDRDITMALSQDTVLHDDDSFSRTGQNTFCPGCGGAFRNLRWESSRKNDFDGDASPQWSDRRDL